MEMEMDLFSSLLEGCISAILSFTSPLDVCRSSTLSWGFKLASDSDTIWEKFLPSDYREIISRSASPVVFHSKKQLYFTLCDSPILLDGGKMSFALDKETGKKCFTLPARELNIAWKNGPQHWQWLTSPESRFWKVARVHGVCWLEIWGNMKTGMLSPKTTYAAFLIFKIMEKFSGLESIPMKVSVRFVGEMEVGNGKEDYGSTVYLRFPSDRPVPEDQTVGFLKREKTNGWRLGVVWF
ncbi:hypothetical protein ACSBR2_030726 [Camellia fascicularis]